ncbi:MAG: fused MFS/spermidine synthase [Planctomycetota bacterium]|nr:fused MFS/spermidine synthase [Planctomycetota bacterium]
MATGRKAKSTARGGGAPAKGDALAWRRLAVVAGVFFVSGAASLIYQVVWNRMLSLQMGSTAYALATILTVFMGGLALGSFLGGRFSGRIRNPLLFYGALEVFIGVYVLVVPLLIDAIQPAMAHVYQNYYGSLALFSFIQFVIAGVLLLPPVTAMGATLPVMAEYLTSSKAVVSRSVGYVYAVNTFGAFAGCLAGGLLLIPALGEWKTNLVAAAGSGAAGVAGILLSRRAKSADLADRPADAVAAEAPIEDVDGGRVGIPPTLILLGFGLSGFAAMTYQVAWTRIGTLTIGSATYAFSIIVGAFILGLALGSAVIGRIGDRSGWTAPLLIIGQFAMAGLGLVTIPLLGDLPVRVFMIINEHSDSMARVQFFQFAALFAIVLPPTFVMGGMLPLVCRYLTDHRRERVGAAVGEAYVSNTIGTIAGSFLAGFALIPLVGMRGAILVAAGLNAAVAAMFVATRRGWLRPGARGAIAIASTAALALAGAMLPGWDRAVITSGPYVNAQSLAPYAGETAKSVREYLSKSSRLIHYAEGPAATVSVVEPTPGGERFLYVSGKKDAGLFDGTQSYLAHLPLVLHGNAKSALVIGLGGGNTLASATLHPSLERIDCVEISPEVQDAALRFFDRQSSMGDPRVNMITGDGRLHLAMTDQTYDVIMSQPSNPWVAGASALFTREGFELMRERLNEGGVACIWVQGFKVSTESVKTLVATFRAVFPEMDLWESRVGGDYFLTGYTGPRSIDVAQALEAMRAPRVAQELSRMDMTAPADFFGYFIASGEQLDAWIGDAPINTDDRTILEQTMPREMLSARWLDVLASLQSHREPVRTRVDAEDASPRVEQFIKRTDSIYQSKPIIFEFMKANDAATAMLLAGDKAGADETMRRAVQRLRPALELNPNDWWVSRRFRQDPPKH